MADQKLTQRTYIDDTSPDALIHVVEAGSSYKQTKENFLKDVVPVTEVYKENQIIDRSYYWVDGTYSYVVVSVRWYEDGTIYDEIFNTTVTMSAADGTYDRIDRVVLNMATDVIEVVEGTPAAVPAPPSLSTDQYELFFVTVETATTEPSTATIYTIYRENAQVVGGEWNTTTGGSAVTNSTVSPYLGTYHVALTAKNDYVDFVPASPIGTGAGTLVFSLKLPDILITPLFAFRIEGSGASSSFIKFIKEIYPGFDSSSADYQTISINLTEAEVSELSTLRITCLRNGSLIYFDEIYLQQAADTQVPPESINASNITVDTTNFNNNLTSADDTVQKALDTLDDLSVAVGAVEGTAVLSTGEVGGTKFLREDGDGTCSWQDVSGESITASNGLTRTADDIALGGTLTGNTTITGGANTLSLSSSLGGNALSVTNSGAGVGVQGQASNSNALFGYRTGSGSVAGLLMDGTGTSNRLNILELSRWSNQTTASGFGTVINTALQSSTGSTTDASKIITQLTDPVLATMTAQYSVQLKNSGAMETKQTINGDGSIQFNDYGLGNITGTPTYALQIDASGNIVEVPIHETIGIACSDETTDLAVATGVCEFQMPFAMTLTNVIGTVTTAPTGSTIIVDINDGGTSIMTTNKISIDATEKTSETAATPPTLTDTALAKDAVITVDIDQIGSTVAGTGLKIWLIGTRT